MRWFGYALLGIIIVFMTASFCFSEIVSENADGSWTVATKKVTRAQLKDELEVALALKKDIKSKCEAELAPVQENIDRIKADIDEIRRRKEPTPTPTPYVDGYIYDIQ